jgi:putative transposase
MDEKRVSAEWRVPEEMWERIAPLLSKLRRNPKGGRPWTDNREIADGIFYVLRTGCRWKAVPPEFGSGSTLHGRFQQWVRRGVFRRLWQAGLFEYDEFKGIQWEWQALDGAMTKAPLGGEKMREKSDGSGEKRYQAFLAHRRRWRTARPRGGRGQSA